MPHNLFAPKIENSVEDLNDLVYGKFRRLYGDNPPEVMRKRVETEMHDIISCHYDVIYMSAQKLVQNSLEHGYLVRLAWFGRLVDRGVHVRHHGGQLLRAALSLPAVQVYDVRSPGGLRLRRRLPDAVCPECGAQLEKDGFNIPFETFLGFGGDKVPDIDLNFSGEYQAKAHAYCVEMFGKTHVFRAGTIGTVAEKTAYGYVKKYLAEREKTVSKAEENRLAAGCVDVKRTTGQHPGGLVVIPQENEIWDFCPVQHPADDKDSEWITTHFEYHSMEENLLKLDMLGHDDPTMIRMLEDMTGVDAQKIPLDDKDTMSIFISSKILGFEDDPILGPVGTCAIPEFGTSFTRGMLLETQPTKFDTLIRLLRLLTRHGRLARQRARPHPVQDRQRQRRHRLPRRHHALPYQVRNAGKAVVQNHGGRPKGPRPAGRRRRGNEGRRRAGLVHRQLQEDQIPLPQGARDGLRHDGVPHRVVQGARAAGLLRRVFLPAQPKRRLRRGDDVPRHRSRQAEDSGDQGRRGFERQG
ncbi:MAG: hypothetical protein V8T01_01915 [Oscillospiraceae bacterium]